MIGKDELISSKHEKELEDWMTFNANAGPVRNCPVFMGAFIDAFHKLTFGFSFQRLAAGLSPIVVGEWSINGPRREITLVGNLIYVAQIVYF